MKQKKAYVCFDNLFNLHFTNKDFKRNRKFKYKLWEAD